MKISEVNVTPVKPNEGLIAFASVVIEESLYIGSIAVYTKLDGSYRLLYPTKRVGDRQIGLFHPINSAASKEIENAIFKKCDKIYGSRGGYNE